LETDPEQLADARVARQAEWLCVGGLMAAARWGAYEPGRDAQGSKWAQEREERRDGALVARAALEARRREQVDGLRAELWLSAEPSRLIRAAADRAGLMPAQVLAPARRTVRYLTATAQ
jgi:hypothetical protein